MNILPNECFEQNFHLYLHMNHCICLLYVSYGKDNHAFQAFIMAFLQALLVSVIIFLYFKHAFFWCFSGPLK